MIMSSRLAGACVALGALAACASGPPMEWTKAGATQQEAISAERQCFVLARDESWRNGWNDNWPPGFYDPTFMPSRYGGESPFWLHDPFSPETEWDLRNFCMHSKGYRLEPIPTKPKS